jgi:hypothetical protein
MFAGARRIKVIPRAPPDGYAQRDGALALYAATIGENRDDD